MSDIHRLRWEFKDVGYRDVEVDAATVIEVGDMLWLDTDDAKPAASKAWNTNLATTQEDFSLLFLGIAMQKKVSTDPAGKIRVACRGVFEMDCASATFEIGAVVAPAKQSGDLLENQKVAAYAGTTKIGRVARRGASVTSVMVEFKSPLVP